MSESESRSAIVVELAEEFIDRYRKGERPPLKEYIDRHPEFAAEIKEVFPAMAMMENIAVADSSLEGDEPEKKPARPAEVALKQLGDYRIIREIGHGGMGVVYEAEQVSLGRHVALKVLPKQALADAKQKGRFQREAKAAARLHHTNIVPVFGNGEHDGMPYYVMQFIQGLGLDVVLEELNNMQPGAVHTPTGLPTAGEIRISRREVAAAEVARSLMTGRFQLSADSDQQAGSEPPGPPEGGQFERAATVDQPTAGGPAPRPASSASSSTSGLSESFTVSSSSITLPGNSTSTGSKSAGKKQSYWQSVANIGRQVADALEYAHKQGILHRDIKPSNLLLDLRGTVWVTDFGLAKVASPDGDNLTHTGDILGTLRYMPPEAFDGKSDARGDVYALGLTMYELLAMRPAFGEKDRNKLIKHVTTGEPAPLHKVNRDTPRDLVTIIHKAIDRDPARRYATALDMASDLQRFLDDEPILARRQTKLERYWRWARHNPGIAILGGVLTAVLLIATLASIIVASRMSTLANDQAQAAADERTARQEADDATKREAKEREQAELSKQRAVQALTKAEENFARARAAVNDYLTAVSEDERLKAPGLRGLRIQLLQSALQFYQQFLKERGNDPTLRRELAGVYYKIGEIYRDLGQAKAANPAYTQALRLYQALAAESPNDAELQHGLAMAFYRSGARAQAMPILEKLINPEDPRYHADLGYVYNDSAISDAKTDKAKELDFLRKALTIRERLVRLKPDDPDARLGLSASLNNIAIGLKDDRNAESLALLQRAVEQGEAAYRLRPTDLLTARFVTIQLQNVAAFAKKVGETEAALAAQRRRVEVLDRRARDNPTIAGFDADLADGYAKLLNELREAGRLDEAARAAEKARARLAEATEESPEFFSAVLSFQVSVHAVAVARAKADPDAEVDAEPEAIAAVVALRQLVLAGWRKSLMQTQPLLAPLAQRADFKKIAARINELVQTDSKAALTTVSAEEKLAARQTILTTLEAMAGAPPHARFVRRSLAQARQDWAQALLEAGQVEEARQAFDDALLVRQQLVQESPSNEQLRADLAQGQSAVGNLFAAAGKLADAVTIWEKALATLEEGLKANPNSIPFRAALSERLRHVAAQAAAKGLWDIAANHYRRAMAIDVPTDPLIWNLSALAAMQVQDASMLRTIAGLAARGSGTTDDPGLFRHRTLTTSPDIALAHADTVRKLGDEMKNKFHSVPWIRALAYLRIGETEWASQTVAGLTPAEKAWPEWQISALLQHRLGNAKEAAEALRQADLLAEKRMQSAVADDKLKLPIIWDEWLHNQLLRAEAHQTIHGKPMPESPYERLYRARILFALDEHDKAEAEFAAAVAIRPDDADVWLTRSRLFAKLGQNERMAADLLHAQKLRGNDPKTWIETGRMLAERGEHQQADVAFARAAVLSKGELNRFLESGWWVVGPYPAQLGQVCPPERDADPSKPVSAVGDHRELKWLTTATAVHSGTVYPGPADGTAAEASFYFLAYVHTDRDRTADLHFRTAEDARLWVNGRLAFDGVAAWGIGKEHSIRVPVSLNAGRNTLLVRMSGPKDRRWFECVFHDAPALRAVDLAYLGLWAQAAEAFAEADRRSPLDAWRMALWIRCLSAGDRQDEARRVFDDLVRRHDRPGSDDFSEQVVLANPLPPDKNDERERWVRRQEKECQREPNVSYQQFWLGFAYYRAARFAEAEKCFRRAIELSDELHYRTYVALCRQQQGQPDEARRMLRQVEVGYAQKLKDALQSADHKLPLGWEAQAVFLAAIRDARTLIDGQDPGPDASLQPLLTRARERLARLDKSEDSFARLTLQYPDQPRLWIDRGWRLGELKRWDEAAKAFAKAAELAPKDVQVWKERGRAYAELSKWDAAAADFAKALELAPKPEEPAWKTPWFIDRAGIDDLLVQWDEVFDRVAKLRPKDSVLWARRTQHFARLGRWAEAEAPLLRCHELEPANHWGPYQVAPLLLLRGDMDGYRRIVAPMFKRFAGTANWSIAEKVVRSVLLMPGQITDFAALTAMLDSGAKDGANRAPKEAEAASRWIRIARAHVAYRSGDFAGAIHQLTRAGPAMDGPSDQGDEVLIVLAMARQQLGEPAAAREALAKARAIVEKKAARPELGWLYDNSNWHQWLRCRLLIREAESLIQKDQVAVAGPGTLSPQEQAAQRDRKARADSLATQAALAQVRLDVGQKREAEAEFRVMLAEREKIAAEEPANNDYQADLAAAHEQLGQFLVSDGRVEEGVKETQQAVSLLEQFAAGNPRAARLQVNLAANLFNISELHWKAGRLPDGNQAWQRALENLKAARGAATKDPKLAKMVVDLELVAGRAYADLGFWAEASGHFRKAFAADPVAGKVSDRFHHAALLVLTGDQAEYRRYCKSVSERSGNVLQDVWSARMLALGPGALPDPASVVALARETRNASNNEAWSILVLALAELRADNVDAAFQTLEEFEKVSKREWQFSWPSLALMRHKAGKPDEARDWLRKTDDWYADQWPKRLAGDGTALTKGNLYYWGFFLATRQEAIATVTGRPAPADPWLHLHRGRVYMQLGLPEKAEAEFQAAAKAQPDDPRILLSRSRIYAALGKETEAKVDRARATQLAERDLTKRPDDGAAADTLAGFLLEKAEPKRTASDWLQAAVTPHAKLGAAYLAIDDAKGAADFLTKATAANPKPAPADWLVLSLAHAKLKDTDHAQKACGKAAELLKPTGADAALRPLLREVALSLGTYQPAVQGLIAAAAGEPPAALNEAIEQNPEKSEGYRNRGSWYGERGRWREALADYGEAFRLEPDDLTGMWIGILLVHTGDLDRFRAHGRTLLERYSSTEKNGEADRTLKTLILHPDVKHDATQLARLAEVAASGDKDVDWYDWYLFAKGLYDCRTGKYDDALTTFRESRRRAPTSKGSPETLTALNLAAEALALHGKGDADEARRTLDQAKEMLKQHVPGIDASWWQDWLIAHILYREAERLIAAK